MYVSFVSSRKKDIGLQVSKHGTLEEVIRISTMRILFEGVQLLL